MWHHTFKFRDHDLVVWPPFEKNFNLVKNFKPGKIGFSYCPCLLWIDILFFTLILKFGQLRKNFILGHKLQRDWVCTFHISFHLVTILSSWPLHNVFNGSFSDGCHLASFVVIWQLLCSVTLMRSFFEGQFIEVSITRFKSYDQDQGRIQNLHCRGAQVTNEAEGFTEARSAERGRVGEGGHPLPQVGVRGASPGNFLKNCIKMVHSECILR